jgi:hypothetical protein
MQLVDPQVLISSTTSSSTNSQDNETTYREEKGAKNEEGSNSNVVDTGYERIIDRNCQ